jgi:hypothetical protein
MITIASYGAQRLLDHPVYMALIPQFAWILWYFHGMLHLSGCKNVVMEHTFVLNLWLSFNSFIRNLKCVCFLYITEHWHFKNKVFFLTLYDPVWHGTVLSYISVTQKCLETQNFFVFKFFVFSLSLVLISKYSKLL